MPEAVLEVVGDSEVGSIAAGGLLVGGKARIFADRAEVEVDRALTGAIEGGLRPGGAGVFAYWMPVAGSVPLNQYILGVCFSYWYQNSVSVCQVALIR